MTFKDYFYWTPVQIRFKDIDKQGHVNNANHFTYIETGRVFYFDKVLGRNIDWDKTGIVLAHTEIDYAEPIFLEDEIIVFTKVSKLGNKSFEMKNSIVKKINGELRECAVGKSVLACYDYHEKKTIEIPRDWRTKFSAFEKMN